MIITQKDYVIRPMEEDDCIQEVFDAVFKGIMTYDHSSAPYIREHADYPHHVLTLTDKVIGFYLLVPHGIEAEYSWSREYKTFNPFDDMDLFDDLVNIGNGVQGWGLAIHPDHRGKGLGDLLKNIPKQLGYNYVWGGQDKRLNNLTQWLKRRKLVLDCDHCYVTAEIFSDQLVFDF